ncbi:MAG: hypothetical protein LBQ98_01035 [Nitrososphaerota archaeon]|jgi:hypothetical protein|nr:hypothetical protein [Nitrososphaerota archaeon]
MKRAKMFVAIALWLIVMVLATSLIAVNDNQPNDSDTPFYVGVTYGGYTVEGAKQLIDKVKNYTNCFILASGELQQNITAVDEVGDYAVDAGLKFAAYLGITFGFLQAMESGDRWETDSAQSQCAKWIKTAQQHWGDQFMGAYVHDEPGGKFLEETFEFSLTDADGNRSIRKLNTGDIFVYNYTNIYSPVETFYHPNGTVKVTITAEDRAKNGTAYMYYPDFTYHVICDVSWPENWPEETGTKYPNGTTTYFIPPDPIQTTVTYYPSGEVTIWERKDDIFYTAVNGSERISQVEPLRVVLNRNPLATPEMVAQVFETYTAIYLQCLENQSVTAFTSDFVWHWWDYRSGYDVVLAELGWNNSVNQEIGLVRGAANLQGKSWGTIITWKYTQAPFLTDGVEMFEQMKASYEAGAEYVIIFNYSEDPTNPNTLQEEHYQVLENFWVEVVENPQVPPGSIKAEAVLVLPKNYGWGMRSPQDRIWGIWDADDTSQQIWDQVQNKLTQYGLNLDIVYDDHKYPVVCRYSHIYYWDSSFFYVWWLVALLLFFAATGLGLFYFRRHKR